MTFYGTCFIALTLVFASCKKEEFDEVKTSNQISVDDISYSRSDAAFGNFIDELSTQLRAYKEAHPGADDKELNDYAELLIANPNQAGKLNLKSAYTDMNGYIKGKLNSLEQDLYKSNKAKAILCMANGKLALTYTEKNYIESVWHNGNGDAFRHALWNFGMTIDVGKTFAKTWSDAHENGTENNPKIEKTMDLFNNNIGIQLGINNPKTVAHSTFISKTKAEVRNGALKIIKKDKLTWSDKYGEK